MYRKTPTQILHSLIGPTSVVRGVEVLGVNECQLLDVLTARVERGMLDFCVTWGPKAIRMTREELAVEALKALGAPERSTVRDRPPATFRQPMNVAEFATT